jgi:phosphate transport system permease protein
VGTAAWPALREFGGGFIVGSDWNPVAGNYGALPFIFGTLASSLLALLIAVPLAVGLAIFLTELAPRWIAAPVAFGTELLAAIPSVVYGLWGIFVLVPWLRSNVQQPLASAVRRLVSALRGARVRHQHHGGRGDPCHHDRTLHLRRLARGAGGRAARPA